MIDIVKIKPVIKWSGSKRSQSEKIVALMPDEISTYYEPFVGGASVLYQLLHSGKKVNNYVCSDKNNDLIELWNVIKNDPDGLSKHYEELWNDLNKDDDVDRRKEYFYSIRKRFNEEKSPYDFLFLSRTCTNGLIRYNSKGFFNTSLHFSRKGIVPRTLDGIIQDWSVKLNENNVQFIQQEYFGVESKEGDFIYLDPPYAGTKGMYYGTLNYEEFWDWIRKQQGKYLLSFDGKRAEVDNTYAVPNDLYSEHIYLSSGRSSFKDLKHQVVQKVEESLYIA